MDYLLRILARDTNYVIVHDSSALFYGEQKMIECYYTDCPFHSKDMPFCTIDHCLADSKDLERYEKSRQERLHGTFKENNKVNTVGED
jgi:hypothetical protein